jgi:hypothetical protein
VEQRWRLLRRSSTQNGNALFSFRVFFSPCGILQVARGSSSGPGCGCNPAWCLGCDGRGSDRCRCRSKGGVSTTRSGGIVPATCNITRTRWILKRHASRCPTHKEHQSAINKLCDNGRTVLVSFRNVSYQRALLSVDRNGLNRLDRTSSLSQQPTNTWAHQPVCFIQKNMARAGNTRYSKMKHVSLN